MVRTQIQLTEEQSKRLKELARRDNISMAEVIRRSVDRYIAQRQGISTEERKRRLLSVAGIGASGDSDLGSEHDRYLTKAFAESGL